MSGENRIQHLEVTIHDGRCVIRADKHSRPGKIPFRKHFLSHESLVGEGLRALEGETGERRQSARGDLE